MIIVFGIKNCDTIKKSLKWLVEKDIEHTFHDYRKEGLERAQLESWMEELGREKLLNQRGTTWRKLPDAVKADLTDATAIDLMLEHPAMIKRPLFDFGTCRKLGFSAKDQDVLAEMI